MVVASRNPRRCASALVRCEATFREVRETHLWECFGFDAKRRDARRSRSRGRERNETRRDKQTVFA